MCRLNIKYAVVILNYNTADDAIIAATSIINNALCDDYVICIVDGCSSKPNQKDILEAVNLPRTHVIYLQKNEGYAIGNNRGIRYLLARYDFQYTIIMNPDVVLKERGSIDNLLLRLSNVGKEYCGIQPLVWTPYLGNNPCMQTCIRRVYSYFDCILDSFYPMRKLFLKTYQKIIYFKERPYNEILDFEVPSGCFFIIKTDVFEQVGLFDESTFLYAEEIILGYKLKQHHYKFLLDPSTFVIHEGGKSTGAHRTKVNVFSSKEEIRALIIYMKKYLHCNILQLYLVKILYMTNLYIKLLLCYLKLYK